MDKSPVHIATGSEYLFGIEPEPVSVLLFFDTGNGSRALTHETTESCRRMESFTGKVDNSFNRAYISEYYFAFVLITLEERTKNCEVIKQF